MKYKKCLLSVFILLLFSISSLAQDRNTNNDESLGYKKEKMNKNRSITDESELKNNKSQLSTKQEKSEQVVDLRRKGLSKNRDSKNLKLSNRKAEDEL